MKKWSSDDVITPKEFQQNDFTFMFYQRCKEDFQKYFDLCFEFSEEPILNENNEPIRFHESEIENDTILTNAKLHYDSLMYLKQQINNIKI